ncbi:MAG: hypothetical protein KC910_30400, partial [Candidatus Eremiobacteraeota bacterium]|nr:hypothetical protein [Candidatus Eremiobacteraeota bacterium]
PSGVLQGKGSGPLRQHLDAEQQQELRDVLVGMQEHDAQLIKPGLGLPFMPKQVKLSPDAAMKTLLKQTPAFPFGFEVIHGNDSMRISNLGDLRDAAALLGVTPTETAGKPGLAQALKNLQGNRWVIASSTLNGDTRSGPLSSYSHFGASIARSPMGESYHANQPFQFESIDFLYNSHDANVFPDPGAAHELQKLEADGFQLQATMGKEKADAYAAFFAGMPTMVTDGEGQVLTFANKRDEAGAAELHRSAKDCQVAYKTHLKAAYERGLIKYLGNALNQVAIPVGNLSAEQKAEGLVELYQAAHDNPGRYHDPYDHTSQQCDRLYTTLINTVRGDDLPAAIKATTEAMRGFDLHNTIVMVNALSRSLPKDTKLPGLDFEAQLGILKRNLRLAHEKSLLGDSKGVQDLFTPEALGHPIQVNLDDFGDYLRVGDIDLAKAD